MTDHLPTPRDYAGVHRVDAACTHCDRIVTLDLVALSKARHGDTALIRLPLRCSGCGKTGHRIIVSGRAYGWL
jgi:hypothetical protein